MKKRVSVVIALMTAALAMAGCGSTGSAGSSSSEAAVSVESVKTLGEARGLKEGEWQATEYEDKIQYGFKVGDKYYVVTAEKTGEAAAALEALDFMDEDYDKKYEELTDPLSVTEVKDITGNIMSREDMDALVGKTGKDLLDNGWLNVGYNTETMEFWMDHEMFIYTIVFDGEIPEAEADTFEVETGIQDMTIKSVEFYGLGDIAEDEE